MPLSDSSSLSACVEKSSDFDMSRQLNEIVSRRDSVKSVSINLVTYTVSELTELC
jgi:hypothetical protein